MSVIFCYDFIGEASFLWFYHDVVPPNFLSYGNVTILTSAGRRIIVNRRSFPTTFQGRELQFSKGSSLPVI